MSRPSRTRCARCSSRWPRRSAGRCPAARRRSATACRRSCSAGRYGIHFAGWKKHVGLYPVGELDPDLEAEVAPHRAKKDTVQFFYKDPVPYDLIERVARALAARHSG